MPSKKKGKPDPSKYAFASGYKTSASSSKKPSSLNDKQKRKAEYEARKNAENRELVILNEKTEVCRKYDQNLKENKELIENLQQNYPELNRDQLYWLSTILVAIGYQNHKLIVVNTDLTKIGCDRNYGIGIYLPDEQLMFWSRDKIYDDYKTVELPECLRSFVIENLITGEPVYPKVSVDEQDYKYKSKCQDILSKYLSEQQHELLRKKK